MLIRASVALIENLQERRILKEEERLCKGRIIPETTKILLKIFRKKATLGEKEGNT